MRIASVSDLHTDFAENRDAVVQLASEIHRRGADLVIIAGDISHKDERIRRAVLAFREVADVVAFVPGNHDLWFDVPLASARADLDTWERYHVELREIVEEAGAHYLPGSPLISGDVAVVGSCGWYDYSMVLPELRKVFDDRTLAAKQFGQIQWSDVRFVAFRDAKRANMDDPAVARQMEAELTADLERVEADSAVQHVVVVTHHPPFSEVLMRTGELAWEFFNAFMGSTGLGRVISGGRKVRAAIYGHTHIVGEQMQNGVRVFGTPLGYPRERRGMSVEDLLRTRIGWVEV